MGCVEGSHTTLTITGFFMRKVEIRKGLAGTTFCAPAVSHTLTDFIVFLLLQRMNKGRNPQPDTMSRVRTLETLSSNPDVSIKSLLSELREPQGRGGRKSVRGRGDGEQGPLH